MGGVITVDSEVGKGACFAIHLPARLAPSAADDHAELLQDATADARARKQGYTGLAQPASTGGKQQKILLVDDDRSFLELAERLMLKEGYSPILTDAPESALQIARTVRPVAIFLDVMMPGLNGWDVLHTLQSDVATAAIPVIMLSVLEDQQRARDNGAVMLITKPLDGGKLKLAMKAAREATIKPGSGRAGDVAALAG
jgi:CheY-like chemotaxis protein